MTSILYLPAQVQNHVRYLEAQQQQARHLVRDCWASEAEDGRQCRAPSVDDLGLCWLHRCEIVGEGEG